MRRRSSPGRRVAPCGAPAGVAYRRLDGSQVKASADDAAERTFAKSLSQVVAASQGSRSLSANVRFFSNRPFGVKHFQTSRRCSFDVAHGLVLLFGIDKGPFIIGFGRRGGTI
jgi:hypothetical protein